MKTEQAVDIVNTILATMEAHGLTVEEAGRLHNKDLLVAAVQGESPDYRALKAEPEAIRMQLDSVRRLIDDLEWYDGDDIDVSHFDLSQAESLCDLLETWCDEG